MSNQQYSPWAGGDGSGEPAPQPSASPADQRPPTLGLPGDPPAYTNPVLGEPRPAEPSGWSEPQTFDALQPAPPAAPVQFGRRVPYGRVAELIGLVQDAGLQPTPGAMPSSGWNSSAAASLTAKASGNTRPTGGRAKRATSSSG